MIYSKGISICKNNYISKKFKLEEDKVMKNWEMIIFDGKKCRFLGRRFFYVYWVVYYFYKVVV